MYKRIIVLIAIILSIIYLSISISVLPISIDNNIKVEVKGEVKDERIYELQSGSTIGDLLKIVELKEDADISSLSKLDKLYNNEIVYIPKNDNQEKVSINHANISDLASLPGIGKSIAKKIVDYRNEYGSFIKLEDLKNVSGIGDKKYEAIKEYICL